MKRINQLAAFALALVVVGGTLSETDAQRRGRQSAQNLLADENVDGVNDSQASRHRRGGQKRGRAGFADQLTTEQHNEPSGRANGKRSKHSLTASKPKGQRVPKFARRLRIGLRKTPPRPQRRSTGR